MHISEVAAISGLSIHTLRYYEKQGILNQIARDSSGRRVFCPRDLEWLSWIQRLKSTGMTLENIKCFAELRDHGDESLSLRRSMLAEHAVTLRAEIQNLQAELDVVEHKIEAYSIKEKEVLT